MNMLKIVAVPIHKEGRKSVAIFAGISVLLGLLWEPLFWLGAGATVWCYYFFRDPVRIAPQDDGLVVLPADGIVSLIGEVVPPAGMGLAAAARTCVSTFKRVFNYRMSRALLAGTAPLLMFGQTAVAGETILAELDANTSGMGHPA